MMLLNFVKEILAEAHYQVVAVPTAEEGLRAAEANTPDLILLDYVLPDMKGDEVLRRLAQAPGTLSVPVIYMSGFGADLPTDPKQSPNVVGSLNKPFTSELLLKTVENYMPGKTASSSFMASASASTEMLPPLELEGETSQEQHFAAVAEPELPSIPPPDAAEDEAAALPYAKPEPKQRGRKKPAAAADGADSRSAEADPKPADPAAEALLPGLQVHAKPQPKPRGRKKAFG